MTQQNTLIFQPYLSNRKLSSGTLERQFRFLKFREDIKVYALLDISEVDYAEELKKSNWATPIVMQDFCDNVITNVKFLQEKHNFQELYIARTYFTPCTKEQKEHLKNFDFPSEDDKYWRNWVPVEFAKHGIKVNHVVYDPLELNYIDIIPEELYTMYSSMNNVENAKPHDFADLGYYDAGKEVKNKKFLFTFGATAVEESRAKLITSIYETLKDVESCNVFIRTKDFDNIVDNKEYEELTSKSMFTYTIPSYDPKYMSFTRMLLALSQGTIPLIHPDNNLDCLFGKDFEYRQSLKEFFKDLIVVPDNIIYFCNKERYKSLLEKWHNTEYYNMLQQL